jgi:hypothetical protein
VWKATMVSPHDLVSLVIVFLNQLNIKKIKLIKIILEKKNIKKPCGKNTVAIHSNLRGKLQCFPLIL